MPTDEIRDDAPTLASLGVLAFIVADVAHEVIGHGAAYLAIGGRSFIMTTTRWIGQGVHVDAAGHLFVGVEHGELYGRIFSLGGPLGSLLFAGLCALPRTCTVPRAHSKIASQCSLSPQHISRSLVGNSLRSPHSLAGSQLLSSAPSLRLARPDGF